MLPKPYLSMQKKRMAVIAICLFLSLFSFAQEKIAIKGIIRSETNAAMPGVTVVVKGSSQVAVTDVNGLFSFTLLRM
jgi:hypothetical protein